MIWNLNTIVPFITFFLYGGLLVMVMVARPQSDSRRRFRWYLLSMAIWSLSAFFLLVDENHSITWMRIYSAVAMTVMISLFYFTQTIIDNKTSWARYVIYYGLVGIVLCLSTDLVITDAYIEASAIHYVFGDGFLFISGPSYLLVIYSIYLLIKNRQETLDAIQRNRLLYLIIAISLVPTISLINFTPLGRYPVDIAVNGISALLITYAILRYQLLDIRIVIRQGLFYSIPTILIGTTYFLIITLSLNIFQTYSGAQLFLISLVVAIITALIAEPIRLWAQSIIDRMFFREKYDATRMLQNLSSSVASVLDLYQITGMILEEVCSTLHIPTAAFFLREESGSRFQLTTQIGHDTIQQIEFRQGHPVVLWLSSHDQPLIRHDIEVLPQFQSLWRSERDDLDTLNAELFIPIKVQDILVGIFLVGSKRSEQAYTMEDIITLSTVANQTAVAIENARLYTSEQTRLREMDTLYTMARQLVTTDNLGEVVSVVAEHAVNSVQANYARILTREQDGDYICRAIYPHTLPIKNLQIGKKEPLVAEHYYNWILQEDRAVVIRRNDPNLHTEELSALFMEDSETICFSPLKGVEEYIGLLVLGDKGENRQESFSSTKIRLINVISDYAASAIQRALLHERLEETFLETIVALANAVDARDTYTGDHSQRMADLSTKIGEVMNLEQKQIEALHWASVLHDIGKIGVPDGILNKKGPLTKEEWVIMKEHPVIGSQIVAPIKYLTPVSPIIRSHHEKFDGSGYPYGLIGEDIPLGARILAIVDAYIAIRDKRVYSESHTHEEAIAELRRSAGSHFDPEIVDIFCKTISE
jgi:HD-GYP domain-containing protein (c-di-GMP phosphodiesterase class II)